MPRKTARCGQIRSAIAGWSLAATTVLAALPAQAATDPVLFSFATFGDSRQDPAAPDPTALLPNNTGTLLPQDRFWLQNTKAFSRMLRTVSGQKPNLLFFNGDMIYAYGRPVPPIVTGSGTAGNAGAAVTGTTVWSSTDANPTDWTGQNTTATVTPDFVADYAQYAYWRGMVANTLETGTYVIPVPGNHETQCNASKYPYSSTNKNPNCASGTHAYAENENLWRANMGDLIGDLVVNTRFQAVTGFAATNVTGLTSSTAPTGGTSFPNNGPITGNQAELSYSFDITTAAGTLHFAIINTDPSGADGIAPSDWLASDFAAAKTRGAVKFFVFGHKPAFTYNYQAASGVTVGSGAGQLAYAGLDAASLPLRNAFWSVIAQYNATYFCGHEHTVNVAQFADPLSASTNTPYQVLVGSGGSAFDDKLSGTCPSCTEPVLTNPSDRYYAWGLVQVHASGAVTLNVYGFSDSFGPTQALTYYNVASLQ
jgi:hypothetical protein